MTNTATYIATDLCGLSTTCEQIITVWDTIPPALRGLFEFQTGGDGVRRLRLSDNIYQQFTASLARKWIRAGYIHQFMTIPDFLRVLAQFLERFVLPLRPLEEQAVHFYKGMIGRVLLEASIYNNRIDPSLRWELESLERRLSQETCKCFW